MPPPDRAVEPPKLADFSTTNASSPDAFGGQRGGHAATAGPDDEHVDDVVEGVTWCHSHFGTAVLMAKPAISSAAGL